MKLCDLLWVPPVGITGGVIPAQDYQALSGPGSSLVKGTEMPGHNMPPEIGEGQDET